RRPPADALVADTASETSPEPVSELPPPVDDMVAEGSEEETAKKPRERPLRPGDIGFAAPKNYDVWSYPPTGDSPDIGLAPMPEDRYQAMGGGQMQAGPTVVGGAYHTYDPRHWSDEEGALAEAKRRKESEKDVSKRMGADVRSQEVQRVQDEKAEEERVYSFVDELYANQGRVRGSRPTESPEQIRARREAEKARLEADLAAKLAAKKAPDAGPTPPGSGPTPPGSGPTSPGGRWIPFPGHPNWEVREDHAADLSGMKPKDILGSYYKGSIRRLGTAIDEPAPLSFEGRAAVNFGRVQAAHAAKLRNEYEVDPTLAESRGGEPGTRAHAAEQYRQSQVRLQKINAETARRVQDFQAADLTLKRSRQNDSTPENIASFEKRRAESHTRLMDIIQKRKAAREQLRSLEGTVEPASMSFEAREAQGVGREWAIHDARMRNEYEMDPVLSRVRLGRVGYQAMMTERTPRGSAAVQGALGLGGGITFKERQELARQAQMKYSRTTTEFERRRSEFEAADTTLEEAKTNKSTPAEVAEFQRQRDVKRAELADITTKQTSARRFMLETEEAAAPSKVDVARNFASIIAATSAYGKAMMVASEIIEKAAIPAVKALGDSLLGWRPTATLITSAMAQQVTAANGNFQAVMAQTGATAGLSKELMKLVSGTVEGSVTAKAGQAALATTGGLVRTAANMGTGSAAPEGLFGGYGGVLGSAFFATEMGGGKGTFETVGDTFDELGKQVDDARNKAAVARGPHESQPWGWIPQDPLSSWIDSMTGVSMDPDQAKSDLATRTEILKGYQGDLNAAFEREAEFSKRPEGAFQVQEDATKEQKDAFLGAAIQTNDPAAFDAAKKMIQNGFVLTDAFGNVTASANELEAALSALAKGKTIADVGTWASGFQRQMEGQMQASAIQAERQRTLSIPWGVAQQTI
ncbi:MAG TPA: hypothetical protein VM537_36835, partial [Anaerolineae bacterium]|nr:hypothetical protein [Anaerolineae bacterium]